MQTVRGKLIQHGASVKFIGNICTLRLNASYRYRTEVEGIYHNLRQEVEILKVSEHQALYEYRK